jgi:predicted nucleic acid-binding protein
LDRISIRKPISAAVLPLVTDLEPGETEVMALALESPGAVIILDDGLARPWASA